jgi:hypothetical protein
MAGEYFAYPHGCVRGSMLTCRSEWQWKEKKYLVSTTPGSSVHFHFIIAPEDEQGLPDTDVDVLAQLQKEQEAMLEDVMGTRVAGEQVVTPESALAEALNSEPETVSADEDVTSGTAQLEQRSERSRVHVKRQSGLRYPGRPGRGRGRGKGRQGKLSRPPVVSQNHAVGLAFMRSRTFGVGTIKCWVDDAEDDAVLLDGYWEEPIRNSVV